MGATFSHTYNTDRLIRAKRLVVRDTMLESMIVVASETKQNMRNSPRSGVTRRSRGSNAMHTASAPGQAPAIDLGELVNSVRGTVSVFVDKIIGFVGAQAGGVGGSRFPIFARFSWLEDPDGLNRPSVAPAWRDERPKLLTRLRKINRKAPVVR